MRNIDVTKADPDDLIDIRNVRINAKLKQSNKIQDYVNQIKNPYCYKYGDYIVKIGFEDTNVTLTERLREIILKSTSIM